MGRRRVLVACEFSGVVRDAFLDAGWDAVSCDLIATERPGPHITGDVLGVLGDGWDMMVAFPPCTYLTAAGARWHWGADRQLAAEQFVRALWVAPIGRVAIENPQGWLNTHFLKPSQTIEPYYFGHAERKRTCLWLRGLPPLMATGLVAGPYRQWVDSVPQTRDRWKVRSRTYRGIAQAMAAQWGPLVPLGHA